jgi:hypothetical protein
METEMTKDERFRSNMRIAHSEASGALSMIIGALCEGNSEDPILARAAAAKLKAAADTILEWIEAEEKRTPPSF